MIRKSRILTVIYAITLSITSQYLFVAQSSLARQQPDDWNYSSEPAKVEPPKVEAPKAPEKEAANDKEAAAKQPAPTTPNTVEAVTLKDDNIVSDKDIPLVEILDNKPTIKSETKRSENFKVRNVYKYQNKEMPKFFQRNIQVHDNHQLPKVFFQQDYSRFLFDAVMQGNISAINTLLDRGADINSKFASNGFTPLMVAVQVGKIEIAKYLILKGADLNVRNVEGRTALHISAIVQYFDLAKLLLENKADTEIEDKFGRKAYDYLSAQQRDDLIFAALHTTEDRNEALLKYAAIPSSANIQYLISKGADLNYKNASGNTALHIAIANKIYANAAILLDMGADPFIKNKENLDAYKLALKSGDFEVLQLVDTYIIKKELASGVAYIRPDIEKKEAYAKELAMQEKILKEREMIEKVAAQKDLVKKEEKQEAILTQDVQDVSNNTWLKQDAIPQEVSFDNTSFDNDDINEYVLPVIANAEVKPVHVESENNTQPESSDTLKIDDDAIYNDTRSYSTKRPKILIPRHLH